MSSILQKKLKNVLIPKKKTQQALFLKNHPEYDGRGIKIAILDGGVDVSLAGMQKTSTGLPKIIDCFDFTGAGHVNTSIVKEVDYESGNLEGLSGRILKIPQSWENPSGKWHLGIKPLYELCSAWAVENIVNLRKKEIAELNNKIKVPESHGSLTDKYLEASEALSKDSLILDCIVWFDGTKWMACLDTSFKGELESTKVMTNFRDCHEHGMILDQIPYCISVHLDGNVLEIFVPYFNHGASVAQVASACFPENPEWNGMAPGAQIISMMVLDSRTHNLTNHRALILALEKCIEMKVDIINYSIANFPKDLHSIVQNIVKKHGIVVVKAGGNSGPVFGSVSSDDDCLSNEILQIGALFTDDILMDVFGIENQSKLPPRTYSFSSRGPTTLGARGIDFVVPGAAVLEMSKFNSQKFRYLRATSYASPNAAGAIACLCSGLKANSLEFSPSKIRFVLSQTAFLPQNANQLGYGNGILQIDAAFEYFKTHGTVIEKFHSTNLNEGKYVRFSANSKKSATVKCDAISAIENLNLKLVTPDPSINDAICFNSENASIDIDPNLCNVGNLTYAEIQAFHPSTPSSICHFPISIIIPESLNESFGLKKELSLLPGKAQCIFLQPPRGSYQCIIKLTSTSSKNAIVDIQYKIEGAYMGFYTAKRFKFDGANQSQSHQIPINWQKLLQISVTKVDLQNYFGNEPINFQMEIQFFGILVVRKKIPSILERILSSFRCNPPQNSIIFQNYMPKFAAKISLECSELLFKINPIKVESGTIEDAYFEGGAKKCQILTYSFTISKPTKCNFKINLRSTLPWYTIQIYTESQKFTGGVYGDFPPKLISDGLNLIPGTYKIIAHLPSPPALSALEWNDAATAATMEPTITIMQKLDKPFFPEISLFSEEKWVKLSTKEEETFQKNQRYHLQFDSIPSELFPNSVPSKNIILQGTLKFKSEAIGYEFTVPILKKYSFNRSSEPAAEKEEQMPSKNIVSILMDFKILSKFPTIQEFVKENKIDEFFKNYDILKTTVTRKMPKVEKVKNQILDELFENTNSLLDEHLKNCPEIPEIFKQNFCVPKLQSTKLNFIWLSNLCQKFRNSFFDEFKKEFLAACIPNFNLKEKYQNAKTPTTTATSESLKNSIASSSSAEKELNEIREILNEECSHFLKYANEGDRRNLIEAKKALILREFGTALFFLNKISSKNQTLPEYKIFDVAIIELLTFLGWNHLAEAHQNAMLDRHRNYLRPI